MDGTVDHLAMRTAWIAVLVLAVAIGPMAGVVAAQDDDAVTRTGGTVIIGPDETVNADLVITAGTAIVQGTVNGDLTVTAGDVLVEGEVTGDVNTFAGSVRVTGTVDGDLSGTSGNFFLGEGAEIGGQLGYASGNAVIDGTIGGDATVGAGSITLGDSAVVQGDFEYDADSFERAAGAQVAGQVVQNPDLVAAPTPVPAVPTGAFTVYGFLVNFLFGAILLLAFPAFTFGLAERVEDHPVVSGGVGLLALIVVPLALLLLTITIIGIPLAVIGGLLFALTLWVAYVLGSYAIGAWLISIADSHNRWLALFVGLLVVALVDLIPFVGGLVNFLVVLLGLGAFALQLRRGYRRRRPAPERVERAPEPGEEAPGD